MCTPSGPDPNPPPARYPESARVLVVAPKTDRYPPLHFKPEDATRAKMSYNGGKVDLALFGRFQFKTIQPSEATPAALADVDTVVLAQLCDIAKSVSAEFKTALVAWIAQGHKLIIQDSDKCGTSSAPDYGFLPYALATSHPGMLNQKGSLLFTEENSLATGDVEQPSFLDIQSWVSATNHNFNELGDSNTITKYDAHWCGALFGTNALKKNGFTLAYAHHGRGLMIYDGLDIDQSEQPAYRQLVTRELAQPFDADRLSCDAPLGDFVLTTESALRRQPIIAAKTYSYPLTLLSNQRFNGRVALSITTTPPDATLTYRFEPDAADLSDRAAWSPTCSRRRNRAATWRSCSMRQDR